MTVPQLLSFFQTISWDGSWPLVAASFAVIIGALLAVKGLFSSGVNNSGKRLPPGPWGVPILGYLPFIRKPFHVVYKDLSEQYGPIIRLRLGTKDVVVLNDLSSIREGLTNPDLLSRPDDSLFRYLGIRGITGISGEPWQQNRRYCLQVLRNLGFAKKPMEAHIQEEVQCFTDILASGEGEAMLVDRGLASSVANNISALLFGQRFKLQDPKGRYLEGLLSKFMSESNFFSFTEFVPALRALAVHIPKTQLYIMKSVLSDLRKFIRNQVKEHERSMGDQADKDFFDGYLRKIKENNGKDSYFSLGAYCSALPRGSTTNFYVAATNTVRSVVLWSLYIAASDPDGHQARVQQEIDAVIGRERPPAWEDRRRMPFTMASILETLRWRTPAPISIPRAAGRDTVIGGYHIPAGTLVVPCLWSLHNDPTQWRNPTVYDPMRFLNDDGKEMDQKPLAFLPFSIGRRACPGEAMAIMEAFLYLTTTLQRFRVLPERGRRLSFKSISELVIVGKDAQGLRFLPR